MPEKINESDQAPEQNASGAFLEPVIRALAPN